MSVINLANVSLQFPTSNRPALEDINYQIGQGDFVILLGSNGSGKSTLLKLLHRDYQPTTGQIYFQDKNLNEYTTQELSRLIAVLSQNCSASLFPSLTVYENFLVMAHQKQNAIHFKPTKQFFIDHLSLFNPALIQQLNERADNLSGGEKQTLALALCLLEPPSLLLLDEHTSALDPKTADKIMQLTQTMVRKYNITCILTTHDLDIAMQYGDRLLILNQGHIHKTYDQNNRQQILTKEKLIAHYI